MLGNLFRECGVCDRLSDTAQNALMNIVTIFLGISVGATTVGKNFLSLDTIKIICLGLLGFLTFPELLDHMELLEFLEFLEPLELLGLLVTKTFLFLGFLGLLSFLSPLAINFTTNYNNKYF
jgi:hypothetical protein